MATNRLVPILFVRDMKKKFRRKVVEASSLVIPQSIFFLISVTGEPVDDPFQPRGPGGRAGGGGGELQHVQN